jgi:hypothetical protein
MNRKTKTPARANTPSVMRSVSMTGAPGHI